MASEERRQSDPAASSSVLLKLAESLTTKLLGKRGTEPKAATFLGKIAVERGYLTEQQLSQALSIQEKLLSQGVYQPLGAICREQGWLSEADLRNVEKVQRKRVRTQQLKEFAEIAVANGFCTAERIRECLAQQKQTAESSGEAVPLEEVLVQRGYLTEQQVKAIRRQQANLSRTVEEKRRQPARQVRVRECSHCFEKIEFGRETCPHCGWFLGTPLIETACSRCGARQTEPGEFCSRCGCHVVTGKPAETGRGLVACANCRTMNPLSERWCRRCGTLLPEVALKKVARIARAVFGRMWQSASFYVPLLIVLAIGVWLLFNAATVWKWGQILVQGETDLRVASAVVSFQRALEYKNFSLLGELWAGWNPSRSGGSHAQGKAVFSAITGETPENVEVEKVHGRLEQTVRSEDERDLYLEIALKISSPAESLTSQGGGQPAAGGDALDRLGRALGGLTEGLTSRSVEHKRTVRWKRTPSGWRFSLEE